MSNLNNMRLCSGSCQMVGAAAALLCIKDSVVIFNSPRWCALTAERELCIANKTFENRLYCTEARQDTLVFGIEEALRDTLSEVLNMHVPSLVSIITSCSMSLIGDDIKGIAKRFDTSLEFITMDAGGLTGGFASGFSKGLTQIASMVRGNSIKKNDKHIKVNIIGLSTAYPHWEGDSYELRRMLKLIGIKVNIVLGIDMLSLDQIDSIKDASLNIVIDKELGLEAAKILNDRQGMPYIISSCPYGFKGSKEWLQLVATTMNLDIDMEMINKEISRAETMIAEHCSWIQHNLPRYCLKQLVSSLPLDRFSPLIKAFYESGINILRFNEVYIKNNTGEYKNNDIKFVKWQDVSQIPHLLANELRILLASDRERILLSSYDKTIYINMDSPSQRFHCVWTPLMGIKGWQTLISSICEQIITLEYIRNM